MAAPGVLQTEYAFTLPFGFVDDRGNLHREGIMRMATTRDEVEPLGDARVQVNHAYLAVLLLSRVISRLGDISPVTPAIIEQLYSADFVYLQELYVRVNDFENNLVDTQCPDCGSRFSLDLREHSHA